MKYFNPFNMYSLYTFQQIVFCLFTSLFFVFINLYIFMVIHSLYNRTLQARGQSEAINPLEKARLKCFAVSEFARERLSLLSHTLRAWATKEPSLFHIWALRFKVKCADVKPSAVASSMYDAQVSVVPIFSYLIRLVRSNPLFIDIKKDHRESDETCGLKTCFFKTFFSVRFIL